MANSFDDSKYLFKDFTINELIEEMTKFNSIVQKAV